MSRILDEVRVATPCPVSWDEMIGTNRARYCHHCRLNVYNLSSMSREDAETLIQGREGRLCVRFFRRADGTMITQDCPVGLRGARWAMHRGWVLLTASLATVLGVFVGVAAVAPVEPRGPSLRRSILDMFGPSPGPVEARPSGHEPPRECVMGDVLVLPPVDLPTEGGHGAQLDPS
jgi:hypothetical protein